MNAPIAITAIICTTIVILYLLSTIKHNRAPK